MNKEKANAKQKAWRKANPEKVKATIQAWREANRERLAATKKAYCEAHREQDNARVKARRALKAGAPINNFTVAQWLAMQAAFKHCCAYCKQPFRGKLTQDHITPISKGGAHTFSNIVPACQSCNSKKHVSKPLSPVQPFLFL